MQNHKSSLNQAQQQAVDAIEGPVLVIAGPGTGKTTLLSNRILNILEKTDSKPENILCLTFTDAGTIAMRKKLLNLLGTEAYRFPIYTFHALCNDIIQSNQERLNKKDLQPLSELERLQFGRELIDQFDMDNPLWRGKGKIYYDLKDLLKLMESMKREDLSVDEIHQKAVAYLDDLPNNDTFVYQRKYKQFNAGDLKLAEIEKETKSIHRLMAAAACLPQYDQILEQNNRYDYNDMILWVIELLKNEEDLLLNLQEKYQYILVDEFQDTNGSQYELLLLLASFWEDNPNLFVVGDDDQSIYRFQGANVANIKDFGTRFQNHLTTVVLSENYRSTQLILDAASTLIHHNQQRFIPDKNLHSAFEIEGEPIQILEFHNEMHESAWVGKKILELIDQGVKAKEIAVIYRNHAQCESLQKFLTPELVDRQTAIHLKKRVDILELPLIKQFLLLLNYVENESTEAFSGNDKLFALLNAPFFQLEPLEIGRFFAWVRSDRKKDQHQLRSILSDFNLYDSTAEDKFKPNFIEELSRVAGILEGLIADYHRCSLPELIEQCFRKSGFIEHVLKLQVNKTQILQAANSLYDFIKEEVRKKPESILKDVLDTLRLMDEEDLSLETESIFYHTDGINFLSAHGSKGLEFEHVFIIDCRDNQWEKKQFRPAPFGLNKLFEADRESALEEERRLFYVAMTRAKNHLYICYPHFDLKDKELQPSQFVNEVKQKTHAVNFQKIGLSDREMMAFGASKILPTTGIPEKLGMDAWCRRILENYRLSVTHISAYLKCQVAFFYDHFLKIPAAMNEYMSFGNAMHASLDDFFSRYKANNYESLPELDDLLDLFKEQMKRQRHNFAEIHFDRRMRSGLEYLSSYYQQYQSTWPAEIPFETEKNISQIEIAGIPVKGTIDKMILNETDKTALVIDFKTGKSDKGTRKLKLQAPETNANEDDKFEKIYGGDYWRQLIFYKLLIENDPMHQHRVNIGMIDFLEPDGQSFVRESRPLTTEDCQLVIEQMKTVWNGINALQFSDGCGDCSWCEFQQEIYPSNLED